MNDKVLWSKFSSKLSKPQQQKALRRNEQSVITKIVLPG